MTLPLPFDDIVPTDDEIAELGLAEAVKAAFARAQAVNETLRQQWPLTAENLAQTPQARIHNAGNQAVSTAWLVALSFDSESYDLGTDTEQHATGAPTRLTCRRAGLYSIDGYITYDVNSTGARGALLRRNGSTYIVGDVCPAAASPDNHRSCVSTSIRLAVGDYIELVAYQTSGGNLDALGGDTFTNLAWLYAAR